MSQEKKEYVNWLDLDLYTKEFKEWVWKLFRKAHARMGHIEEDLAKVRKDAKTDYRLRLTKVEDKKAIYSLEETVSNTNHGNIEISTSGEIIVSKWEEAGTHHSPITE